MIVLLSVLWVLTVFLVIATALPFTKLPLGAIQGLAFPRAQFLGVAVLCALGHLAFVPGQAGVGAACVMAAVAVIQATFIAKFTPFWSRQSLKADKALLAQTDTQISVLTANVKMSNRAYGRLAALTKDRQPDVLIAIEVDRPWIDALKVELSGMFDHWVEEPKDNGYGMCLMSKLPLSDVQVRTLVTREVPSIRARVTLGSGQDLRLYVLHPEPPVINHDTLGRDSEIALVGIEAAQDPLPVIVTGDLNDVAWSTTTRRFQRLSRLLDPRVGRGFYNTFSATMPWMRWPLDHLFHSPQFRLVSMARLSKIGSDHFPMWFALALAKTEAINSDPGHADAQEVHETKEMIRDEQRRTRNPIGEDWEQAD